MKKQKGQNLKNFLKNRYDSISKSVNTVTAIVTGNVSKLDYQTETLSNPAFKKQVQESGYRPSAGPKRYKKKSK